jgi:type IV pilus assembly protein PilE
MDPTHGPDRATPVRAQRADKGIGAGWSLLEMMVVLALAGILLALAWPGYDAHLLKIRRLDAQHSLQALHLAQTRWRSQTGEFASTLSVLGWPSLSSDGHYRLDIAHTQADGYLLLATGLGAQARDHDCNPMRLQLKDRATLEFSGGPAQDRHCWR